MHTSYWLASHTVNSCNFIASAFYAPVAVLIASGYFDILGCFGEYLLANNAYLTE